jgi:hypothetical protein
MTIVLWMVLRLELISVLNAGQPRSGHGYGRIEDRRCC